MNDDSQATSRAWRSVVDVYELIFRTQSETVIGDRFIFNTAESPIVNFGRGDMPDLDINLHPNSDDPCIYCQTRYDRVHQDFDFNILYLKPCHPEPHIRLNGMVRDDISFLRDGDLLQINRVKWDLVFLEKPQFHQRRRGW